MSNRRYQAEETTYQRYFDESVEPPILRNKLGIKNHTELEKIESEISISLTASRPYFKTFSLKEARAIHKHLFSPLYHWAGKLRDYTTGRGATPFARPEMIKPFYQTQIFQKLKQCNYLIDTSQMEFIHKSAYFINEFNAIHPFVDGNGRITRIFLTDLAEKSGHHINIDFIERERWYAAMEYGFRTAKTELIEREIAACFLDYNE